MRGRMYLLWSCLALGCAPETVSSGDGETGSEETGGEPAPAPAHWLIYDVAESPQISLRAVDLGGIEQGEIGPPVELLDTNDDAYGFLGPTPWGGWAFTIDDAFMLIGLDAEGQIEVYPGVPDGVPGNVEDPRFSADGHVALFAGPPALPPDYYYWARYEHGRPVEGGPLAPMSAELSSSHHVSPDGSYGAVRTHEPGENDEWYWFTLDGGPSKLSLLFEEGPAQSVAELFDDHLFGIDYLDDTSGSQLIYVEMSSDGPGQQIPIEPATVGWRTYFSPAGDIVAWLGFVHPGLGTDGQSSLWRADIIDGVPTEAVELAGFDDVVEPDSIWFAGSRLGWQPYTKMSVRWVDLVDGQLGPIHTIDAASPIFPSFSPDRRFVSWIDGSRAVATLDGPQSGVPHYLEQDDPDYAPVTWFDDRMFYTTTAGTKLWMVPLGDDGPGPATQLDVPSLAAAHAFGVGRERIVDHDVLLLGVQPEAESDWHVELLRLDVEGSPETLPIDEAPRSRVIHQIVRE